MTPDKPARDNHVAGSEDDATVYAFLRHAENDLIRHLDNALPIEAAITKTLINQPSPSQSADSQNTQDAEAGNRAQKPARTNWRHKAVKTWIKLLLALRRILCGIGHVWPRKPKYNRQPRQLDDSSSIEEIINNLSAAIHKAARRGGKKAAQHRRDALYRLQELSSGLETHTLTKDEAYELIKKARQLARITAQQGMQTRSKIFGAASLGLVTPGVLLYIYGSAISVSTPVRLALLGAASTATIVFLYISDFQRAATNLARTGGIDNFQLLQSKVARLFDESDDHTTVFK